MTGDLTYLKFSRAAKSRGYTVNQLIGLVKPWYDTEGPYADTIREFAERLLIGTHKSATNEARAVIPYRPIRELFARWMQKSRKRTWDDPGTCQEFTAYCACHGVRQNDSANPLESRLPEEGLP